MDIDQTEDHNPMVMIPDTEPKIEIEESESSMEIDDVSQNPHNLSECTGDLNLDNLDLKLAWLAKNWKEYVCNYHVEIKSTIFAILFLILTTLVFCENIEHLFNGLVVSVIINNT